MKPIHSSRPDNFLLLLPLFLLVANLHAGWSVSEGLGHNYPGAMRESCVLLQFPDGEMIVALIDSAGLTIDLTRFTPEMQPVSLAQNHIPRWTPEGSMLGCVVGDSLFALAVNGRVSNPPDTNGAGILVRVFDRSLTQLWNWTINDSGDERAEAITGRDGVVYITGVRQAPPGRAFLQASQVDGFHLWSWEDPPTNGLSSVGLDLAWFPGDTLVMLGRHDQPLESRRFLARFTRDDTLLSQPLPGQHSFRFHRGRLQHDMVGSRLLYLGWDSFEQDGLLHLGLFDYQSFGGWDGPLPGLLEGNPGLLQIGERLILSSPGPEAGWTRVDSLPGTDPSVPLHQFAWGASQVVPAPDDGFVLAGRTVRRYSSRGTLYYSFAREEEIVHALRLSDSSFVALERLPGINGGYSYTLQEFVEEFANLPLAPLQHLAPPDGAQLALADSASIALLWNRPIDPDPDTEPLVTLTLQVERYQRPDTLFTVPALTDTSFSLVRLAGHAGVPTDELRGVVWSMYAVSQGDTAWSDRPWSFTLSPLQVEESPLLPEWEMTVWPNPFNGAVHVAWTLQSPGETLLELHDLLGRLLERRSIITTQPGLQRVTIHPEVSSGSYLLTLRSGEGRLLAARRITLLK